MVGTSPSGELPAQATLERHVRQLDRASLASFVVDLWAARGFDTTREGDVVRATDDGETLRVGVVPASGLLRLGSPTVPDDADVVVAPGGPPRGVPGDVEVVDAADIAGMLRYAVDADAAATLCERHLGGDPGSLSLSPVARARSRLAGVSGASVAALVVAALLVAWAVASMPGGPPTGAGTATPGTDTPTGTPDPASAAGVPGLDESGITNLSALAAAHASALDGRSYKLWINHYREPLDARTTSTKYRHTRMSVNDDRYLAVNVLEVGTNRIYSESVYRGSGGTYVFNLTRPGTSAYELPPGEQPLGRFGSPESFQATLALRYLQVKSSRVTGWTTIDDRTMFRIEGTGAPVTATAPGVRNYTVSALVDRQGLIHELTASFVVETPGGSYQVDVEVRYGRFGETVVQPPDWYERATSRTPTPTSTATPAGNATTAAVSRTGAA